jgi:AcrR family transcriptional regulator
MSRSTAAKHDKEQAILEAAARVFRRSGYARATLRDIAGEAGILLGSLQYRYMTKDVLFVALAERELARVLAAIAEAREAGQDPLDRVRHFVYSQAEEALGDESLVVWLVDTLALSPEEAVAIAKQRARFPDAFDALLSEAVAAGQLRADVPVPMLRNYILGPLGWTAQRVFGDMPYSPREMVDAYWRLALEGAGR